MIWNAKKAIKRYKQSSPTDAATDLFKERMLVCQECEHRTFNKCTLSNQIVSIVGRDKIGRCPEYLWPNEERPVPPKPSVDIDYDRPLNCLMFTGSLGLGGAEEWIRVLTNGSKHNWKILVFPNGSSEIITNAVLSPMISWDTNEKNILSYPTQEEAFRIATTDIDVVVCWGGTSKIKLPTSQPAIGVLQGMVEIAQSASANPTIGVAHGCCEWTKQTLRDSFKSHICSHYVAVSEAVSELCPPGTSVILNGIDKNRLAHGSKEEARKRFGLPLEGKIAAYIGRLSPDKNCEVLAEAISKLPDKWTAFFCGDGGWREKAVTKIQKTAGDRAIIHSAVSDVGNAFTAADVIVSTSQSEGCCLATIEAWYLGKPVVSTRVGAIPEIERDVGQVVVPLDINPSADSVALGILLARRKSDITRRAKYWARLHGTSDVMIRHWDRYLSSVYREKINAS